MEKTLGQRIRDWMDDAGFRGLGSQEKFRQYIKERHGVDVTAQALSLWLHDGRVPGGPNLIGLLDALGIHGPDREAAMAMAYRREMPAGNRESA